MLRFREIKPQVSIFTGLCVDRPLNSTPEPHILDIRGFRGLGKDKGIYPKTSP